MMSEFVSHSGETEPKNYKDYFISIGDTIEEICAEVQSLLIHAYWLEEYQYPASEKDKYNEMQLRSVYDICTCANAKQKISNDKRNPQLRVISTCRDYSLLVCSILRSKGTSARLRCGFATYLRPDAFEDHWVCEYWDSVKEKWLMVDAQLDRLLLEKLDLDFSEYDVPSNKFLFAGKAWELCRTGEKDPAKFGIHHLNGLSFVKGNIVRDLFALGKIETLPWDHGWGILKGSIEETPSARELVYIDELATISSNSDSVSALEAINSRSLALPTAWSWSSSPTISALLTGIST